MPSKVVQYSRQQPARAILIVVCGLTLLAGLFMLTPLYGPVESAPLFGGPVESIGIYGTAVVNIVLGLAGIVAVRFKSMRWKANAAFSMFIWYFFIALSRALLFPYPGRLLWLPPFMVALIMGIIYLEKKNKLSVSIKVSLGSNDRAGDLG